MASDRNDHYFSSRPAPPSRPRTIRADLAGERVELETDAGVFSPHRLDPGTAVLLRAVPDPPERGDLLDLGCGYGPLAVAMALRSPSAQIWAVDTNERALECARRNAERLGLANLAVCGPDDAGLPGRLAGIWSNPPVRVGKAVLHELLDDWLGRLEPGARAHLVVHRHLGADSLHRWLAARGLEARRVASKRGYRVLAVGVRA